MPRKTYTPREVLQKLRKAEALSAAGASPTDVAKIIGVSPATLSQWRERYDDLAGAGVRRIKMLEAENARLRRAIAELDAQLSEAAARASKRPRKQPKR
ncbi:MAG: transposase [Hyphomonadaceae bacterium]|nr:transposase [Hyphomonadaceae bacterium]